MGILISSDPTGNSGDVKAFIYSWIEPIGKEGTSKKENSVLSRVVAQYDFPKQPGQAANQTIKRLTFNPKDNNQIVTSGNNHWRLWKIQENIFKPMPQFSAKIPQNHNFVDQVWLDEEKQMTTTADGELFIAEGMEMKQYIENAFNTGLGAGQTGDDGNDSVDEIVNITAIKEFAKGFFVGSDNGYLAMWIRSEENNSTSGKQAYDFIRRW